MRRIKSIITVWFLSASLLLLMVALTNSANARSDEITPTAEQQSALTPPIPGTFLTGPNEGQPLDIALDFIQANRATLQLSTAEISNLVVKNQYQSRKSGITHIYLIQTHNGIELYNAVLNINIGHDGSIINIGSRIVPHLTGVVQETEPELSAVNALQKAAEHLNLQLDQPPIVQQIIGGPAQAVVIAGSGISRNPIPVQLIYQPMPDGAVRLAWELVIYDLSGQNWWQIRIDAADGKFLDKNNLIIHDDWGGGQVGSILKNDTATAQLTASAVPSSYLVYPMPVESPNFAVPLPPADARTTELSPWLNTPTASPIGWHATSTMTWTNTQGNNVDAHKATARYDCGPSLECDPPLDLTMEPTTPGNVDAALVNLFYWNNIVHDVTYEYGFDEVAGNFQVDNFGLGGLGGDRVNASMQSIGTCGGSFGTPPDGSQPIMIVLTCDFATPARDGALDNVVTAHEYGHGVSRRLTGGPLNVSCLSNEEQMGEGWSDWLGLTMTIEPGDAGIDQRTIGTWFFGQGPNGPGVRNFPYTTDFNLNPHTYSDIITAASPHDVGEVWGTMLWDMVWTLIDNHGYNPNIYADWSTGGNNLAFQLVLDGMKLQSCSPGFVDGRDAILLADQSLTGGQNQCLIWQAFANRGLGLSADQGSSNSITDGTEAFDMPSACSLLVLQPTNLEICAGDIAEYEVTVGSGFTPNVNLSVEGHPPGTTAAFSPNPVTAVPATSTLTIDNTAAASGSYSLTITGTDSTSTIANFTAGLTIEPVPGTATLTTPADNAVNIPLQPTFLWTAVNQTESYLLELDDALDFNSLVYSATVEELTHIPTITLEYETTYYWRVTAANNCGLGPASNIFSFTTLTQETGFTIFMPVVLNHISAAKAPG